MSQLNAQFEEELATYGPQARLQVLQEAATTVQEVARHTGLSPERLLKSLVVLVDDVPHLALIFGERRLDLEKLRHVAGAQSASLMPRKRMATVTGYAPGDVPPVGVTWAARVWLDLHHPVDGWVVAGGGYPQRLLWLAVPYLYERINCTHADISN